MSLTLQFRDATSVRKEIAIRGESIAIFSKRIGVNYSLMTEYLNNKKHPSPPTAKKIAKGLDKEIKDIFLFKCLLKLYNYCLTFIKMI